MISGPDFCARHQKTNHTTSDLVTLTATMSLIDAVNHIQATPPAAYFSHNIVYLQGCGTVAHFVACRHCLRQSAGVLWRRKSSHGRTLAMHSTASRCCPIFTTFFHQF